MAGKLIDYPDVMTVEDLMDFLHIGRSVAYRMLKTNEIKSIRVGNRVYRIPKKCVAEWLDSAYNVSTENTITDTHEKGVNIA